MEKTLKTRKLIDFDEALDRSIMAEARRRGVTISEMVEQMARDFLAGKCDSAHVGGTGSALMNGKRIHEEDEVKKNFTSTTEVK